MTSPKPESYPLLRDAYAIIDGIPAARFGLNQWQQTYRADGTRHTIWSVDEPLSCNTIACAAGWLALHPDMQAKGVYVANSGSFAYNNRKDFDALSKFFGLTYVEAQELFGTRSSYETGSHKSIFLARVRKFLAEH